MTNSQTSERSMGLLWFQFSKWQRSPSPPRHTKLKMILSLVFGSLQSQKSPGCGDSMRVWGGMCLCAQCREDGQFDPRAHQPVSLAESSSPRPWKTCLKTKQVADSWEVALEILLWPPHPCRHTDACVHARTQRRGTNCRQHFKQVADKD